MFDYADPTVALIPNVSELQVDNVELSGVLDGVVYTFRGNILVELEENYESFLTAASGLFYVGDDCEEGLRVHWEETNTDCFRIIAMCYEYDDVLKDSVAYKARYQ